MNSICLTKTRNFKVQGSILQADTIFYILFVVFLAAVVAYKSGTIIDFYHLGVQTLEMSSIESAATAYTSQRVDGAAPTSMQDLIDGIPAADSITGAEVNGLLKADSGRFKNGTYKDAFGSDFVFGTSANGDRYIASPGRDRQPGTDDDIYAYY